MKNLLLKRKIAMHKNSCVSIGYREYMQPFVKAAASKTPTAKKLTLRQAKREAYKLIHKFASESKV